jgi:hypothetical protein
MDFTWGFIVLLAFFVLPGMILRRLYFHNEFSKQFGYNEPLINMVFYSLMPGIVNAIIVLFVVDHFFFEIDLGKVIDSYKLISDKEQVLQTTPGPSIKEVLYRNVLPFLSFILLSSLLLGVISGRMVRILGLDTRWKVLRYKNYWYYLFSGKNVKMLKYKFLINQNQVNIAKGEEFLFTNVDVLIGNGSDAALYSGIIVDYELDNSMGQELSKIVLRNAKRYSSDDSGKRVIKTIPGSLFILDCKNVSNINLTYVFGKRKAGNIKVWPKRIYQIYTALTLLILPIFVFKVPGIEWNWYHDYFESTIVGKLFFINFFLQVAQLLNPIFKIERNGNVIWMNFKYFIFKVVLCLLMYFVATMNRKGIQ